MLSVMPDVAPTQPASMTQSTGNISMAQIQTTHEHPHTSISPRPLRKATSDNQQISPARVADGRRSPRSALHRPKSPTSGAASKTAGTALAVTYNAPADTETITQGVKPVFPDLPSSIGDQCFPRRPSSLPSDPRNVEKADVGRRLASEQRDCFDSRATAALVLTTTKNITDVASDVDDSSWTTSFSHNSSPASQDTLASVTYQPRCSPTTSLPTDGTTSTTAGHSGDSSEYQLLPDVTSSSIPDSVNRPQVSSATVDTNRKVLCTLYTSDYFLF